MEPTVTRFIELSLCATLGFLSCCVGSFAQLVVLTPDNFDLVVGKGGVLVVFSAPWCRYNQSLAPQNEEVDTTFGAGIGMVYCGEYSDLCSKYGVQGNTSVKWFPPGSQNPIDININPTNKEVAAIPSHIVVVTPTNFDSVVLDKTKDVLVEFYIPECMNCNYLATVYQDVATFLKRESHVVVAKCDVSRHRELVERYGLSNLEVAPTIKFFPKYSKEGMEVQYDGDWYPMDFVDIVNKQAGTHGTPSGGVS